MNKTIATYSYFLWIEHFHIVLLRNILILTLLGLPLYVSLNKYKMEEFSKTPAVHLIGLWIDLNRPQTQWTSEVRPGEWTPTDAYKETIKKIEITIVKKLQLTLLETRIVLNCKKTCQDAQEAALFNSKKRKNDKKDKKVC